jgi:hypothetical protein
MSEETDKLLTKGMLTWSGGVASIRTTVSRAGFELDTNDFQGPDGKYHDEWIDGGGQELVETSSGEKATRVYCGRALPAEELQKLGLTKKDVIGKLKLFVCGNSQTRLGENAEAVDEGWKYIYNVLEKVPEISAIAGVEKIWFKGKLVFAHFHCVSPAK